MEARQAEIAEGQVIVYAQDECHLLWGDTTGYVWGRRNEKTGVPIQNIKQRQTYYGALNLYHRDFVLMPHDGGNSKNTVAFIKHLQNLNPDKKLILIWDGASYHRSEEVRTYLNQVNEDLEEKNWKITCLLFAPNAPEQNPVEDVWLRGKNFLRKHFYKNKTFRQVKRCFSDFINQQTFDFNKIDWYFKKFHNLYRKTI
ncbi:transposase [Candidatus Competibacter phosphatis]|uniref:Transposase n=1 Tax=Candidatus Competibacter phosphatis TaxID=221280 RepID=A0ABX1TF68_9GAMM|nr:transposase [Candidatus Competibacter phosphatis]